MCLHTTGKPEVVSSSIKYLYSYMCVFILQASQKYFAMNERLTARLKIADNNKVCIYTYIHIYIYMYIWALNCAPHNRWEQCVDICSCIHIYMYTFIHVYIYTYIHINTHTHTHIHTNARAHTHTHNTLSIFPPFLHALAMATWRRGEWRGGLSC